MNTSINILILEDSKMWAEMMVRELERHEYQVSYDLVTSENEFREAIKNNNYDIILADYSLPQWDGEKAFHVLQSLNKHIPFILISGMVDEQKAIDLLKEGIQDLNLKQNLFRLPTAVRNALREKELRTRELEAKKSLEKSELKFRGVLEQSELAIIGYDADGTVIFWNKRCSDIFGQDASRMLGKNVLNVVPHEEQDRVMKKIKQVFRGDSVSADAWHRKNQNGQREFFHTSYYGVRDYGGNVVLGVAATLDVTERRRLEDQLVQAQKMEAFGQLVGGITHDFNNLLTVIIGNLNLVLNETDSSSSSYALLMDATLAANQCSSTVKGLMALGRKSEDVEKVTLDFHVLLANFEKIISHLIPSNIEIEFHKNAQKFLVDGDNTQIHQVLLNLALNARDAMPNGGLLVIDTQNVYFDEDYAKRMPDVHSGQFFCISVTDSGEGIPEPQISRIFEPFYTTKKDGKGTGLGLSMVYGIVKSHGGWIRVYSEPGKGTTFKVYFPISMGNCQKKILEDMKSIMGGSETILIADDEDAIRNLAQAILERKGYNVLLAKNGEELDSIIQQKDSQMNLILMDMIMPKFVLEESLKIIQQHRPNVPVIISSGYSLSGEQTKELLSMGAVGFIQKPYNPEDLTRIIRSVLDMNQNQAINRLKAA